MAERLKEFLSATEVAEVLGLNPVTIYRWCRAGRLASIKIGKEWRIRRDTLDELLGRSLRTESSHHGDGREPMHAASRETTDLARRLLQQAAGERHGAAALAVGCENVVSHQATG